MLPVITVLTQYLCLSVCLILSILGLLCSSVWSWCFALPSPSPRRHINRPETEADLCELTVTLLSSLSRFPLTPASLFFPMLGHCQCLSHLQTYQFPSDCQDRKQRTERGSDLSSSLSLTLLPPLIPELTGTEWNRVHMITMLSLKSINRSLQWPFSCFTVCYGCGN